MLLLPLLPLLLAGRCYPAVAADALGTGPTTDLVPPPRQDKTREEAIIGQRKKGWVPAPGARNILQQYLRKACKCRLIKVKLINIKVVIKSA